jgi:hypothetical protein
MHDKTALLATSDVASAGLNALKKARESPYSIDDRYDNPFLKIPGSQNSN